MSLSAIAAFWVVSILFVITPGADWAYAITAGLRHRTVLPAIAGLLAGHLTATLVVAVGVAAIVSRTPLALTAITAAGALYLVWLGAGTLARPAEPHAETTSLDESPVRRALRGYAISGLNPKVLLLFLALLPQFTEPRAGWPLAAQILLLGLVQVVNCGVIYTAVGTGARAVLSTRPTAARAVSRFSGVAMVVIGIALLVERFMH
jgi:threonine/homoserine/homoserine lactone efflux protein